MARAKGLVDGHAMESALSSKGQVTIPKAIREIARVVEGMLQSDTLVVQNEQEVFTAVAALRSGRGPFADALVSALGRWAGCTSTLTFDKKAGRMD